jgi:hypothetical protein
VGREKTASLPGGITRTTGYDTTGVIKSIAYAQGTKNVDDDIPKHGGNARQAQPLTST